MSWVSDSELVAAISNAGGFGVFACGHMNREELKTGISEIRARTEKPFGVNLITIAPNFRDQLETMTELNPGFIVFAGRLPREEDIGFAKEMGQKVMTFAPNLDAARRMVKAGADALIIEGHEAGGHVGSVSTFVLLQEILFEITEVPVFVAGGIATGKMTAYLLLMGAAGVQLGTRFMLTEEADIAQGVKEAFLKSKAKDVMVSFGLDRRLGVVPVRSLHNKGVEEFTRLQIELLDKIEKGEIDTEEATNRVERFWLGALKRGMKEGDLEYGSLMAGNAVGLMNEIKTVSEVIRDMIRETDEELAKIEKVACRK
jgi:enoyl-[acyl-carrier protein] reductase II